MAGTPIEGQVLLLAAAKASVGPARLSDLVDATQAHLDDRRERYAREFERAATTGCGEAFFVDAGHWEAVGETLGLARREREAVRRVHEEQLLRVGRRDGREAEFERALEIREVAFVGAGGID